MWCCSDDVSKAQRDSVAKFLSSLGEQHYVQDESYLDMATAVSGSGPGYVLVGGVGCMHVCLCFIPPKKRYHTDGWIYVHRPHPSTITTIIQVILEALIDGAVHLGFSREVASKLVLQTVYGTTAMAMKARSFAFVIFIVKPRRFGIAHHTHTN